jgi:hypothetical protein
MPDSFRSSRKVALEKNDARNFAAGEVPEENKPGQYADSADAAKPSTHGGQSSPADPQPFALRGSS